LLRLYINKRHQNKQHQHGAATALPGVHISSRPVLTPSNLRQAL
jgi:hypothetical protein